MNEATQDTSDRALVLRPAHPTEQAIITRIVQAERLIPFGLSWSRFLVAEMQGQIVGVGQLKPHRDGSLELASLAVLPDYRRRGIGSLLVRTLITRADSVVYLMCRESLEPYYERFGFRRAGLSELPTYFMAIYWLTQLVGWFGKRWGDQRAVCIMRRAPAEDSAAP